MGRVVLGYGTVFGMGHGKGKGTAASQSNATAMTFDELPLLQRSDEKEMGAKNLDGKLHC